MAGREGEKSVVVSSVVLASWLDEVPVSGVDSSEASGVSGVEGGLVESLTSVNKSGISLSLSLGLRISLSLSVEVPVSEVVVSGLVEAPGVSGVDSGVTVGVEGGIEETLASIGGEEHLGLSLGLRLSLGLSLSFSLGQVGRVGGVGGVSWEGGVAGVAGHGSGVAIGDVVSLLVTEGVVVQLGVGLSLSSSQSSATDLSMRSKYGENYRELLFTTIAILIIFLLVLSSKEW